MQTKFLVHKMHSQTTSFILGNLAANPVAGMHYFFVYEWNEYNQRRCIVANFVWFAMSTLCNFKEDKKERKRGA